MARGIDPKRKKRNEDIRFLCNILHNKYYVDISKLARALKLQRQYYYDFVRGNRDLLYPNLLKIEAFIFDLYDAILYQEMDLNNIHLAPLEEGQVELNV